MAANDGLAAAQVISGVSGEVEYDYSDATLEPGEDYGGYQSVWFSWAAPTNAFTTFRVVSSAEEEVLLHVFSGPGLDLVGQDVKRDGVGFAAERGATYIVRVAAWYGTTGGSLLWFPAVGERMARASFARGRS